MPSEAFGEGGLLFFESVRIMLKNNKWGLDMLRGKVRGAIGAIEVVLIVVVLAVTGLVVWRVMSANEEESTAETTTETQDEDTTNGTTGEEATTDNLVSYTNDELGFTFSYPEAWGQVSENVLEGDGAGQLYEMHFTKDLLGNENSSNIFENDWIENVEIGAVTDDFMPLGTDRPLAESSGFHAQTAMELEYAPNSDFQSGIYFTPGLEAEVTVLSDEAILVVHHCTAVACMETDVTTSRLVVNLDDDTYRGIEFIAHDRGLSTERKELLLNIWDTFQKI